DLAVGVDRIDHQVKEAANLRQEWLGFLRLRCRHHAQLSPRPVWLCSLHCGSNWPPQDLARATIKLGYGCANDQPPAIAAGVCRKTRSWHASPAAWGLRIRSHPGNRAGATAER